MATTHVLVFTTANDEFKIAFEPADDDGDVEVMLPPALVTYIKSSFGPISVKSMVCKGVFEYVIGSLGVSNAAYLLKKCNDSFELMIPDRNKLVYCMFYEDGLIKTNIDQSVLESLCARALAMA